MELTRLPEFWETIFGPGLGYLALFSGVRPEPGARLTQPRQAFMAYPQAVRQAMQWVIRADDDGCDVYHGAHLLRRAHRRREDAAPLHTLYVDLDRELREPPLLLPSLVVETSPGHGHLYFRLSKPVEPSRGAALNRRLAAALGGDASGWDLTQLLRLPGTHNHKLGDGPLVRLVAEHHVQYDPRELEGFLPRLPELPVAPPRQAETTPARQIPLGRAEPPIPLTHPALAIWNGEDVKLTPDGKVDRSASLMRIARILHRAGLTPQHMAQVLAERDEALGWRKYADRKDAEMQYRRIVAIVLQDHRT